MKTIRWGMIGCGNVTEVKSGPGFYKANNSILYGVTNRTISKAYDYAKRHPVEKVFETVKGLIYDENIDAVYIATPPNNHKEYALMCADAKKVCYIEKPMALDYAECLEIINAFEKANVKAYVAYYRRRMDKFMKAKAIIDNNTLGDIRFVRVALYRQPQKEEIEGCWRVVPEIAGGGIFMDMAVHELDILDYMLGEMVEAKGIYENQGKIYKPEDNVTACFRFKSGVTGTGVWCFNAYQSVDVIEVVGSLGGITFECFGAGPITLETKKGKQEIAVETPQHVHQNLIQSIVDELNGVGECPSTLLSAARTSRVCDMIYGR